MEQNNTEKEYQLPHRPHHFATKKVIILGITFLLIAVSALVGASYVSNTQESTSEDTSPTPSISVSPTNQVESEPVAQWNTYKSNESNWQIQYSPDLDVRKLPAEQTAGNGNIEDINFFKVGETQAEGTEFYDGLSLTVSVATKPRNQSLHDFADMKTSQDVQVATRDYFRAITINNLQGYEAQITGLGTFNHIFLPHGDSQTTVIWISYLSVGPDKQQYDEIVEKMINSFKLSETNTQSAPSGVTMCTMDAKICPDGSTVGRQGPNCEFAACPLN